MHRTICEVLDRVVRKELDRVLILCPPQHGKSTIASRRLPAFILGQNPRTDVISASATSQLAEEFGRDVRNCIASSEYRSLFDTALAEDSQAKGRWNTTQGGGYYAIGVGGALMGRGAELGLIDDPFATWTDAQSELTRDSVWEWYRGTFYNRIRPGGAIVVIQHRMHEDDLVGRLLAQQSKGGDRWTVVEIPADVNDPPWAERYNREALERLRANTDQRKWSALYLQNPTPDEGTFFKREWFTFYDKAPETLNAYTSSDFAVTEDGGDYTEIATHGIDTEGRLFLGLDWWWGQTSADVWIDKICDQVRQYRPYCFFGESGVIRRAIEPVLVRRMDERGALCRMEWITRTRDKATMARALQSRAAMGKVFVPDNEAGHRFVNQALGFPAGRHDDAVDCAALMAMALDMAHPAILKVPEPEYHPTEWS